MVDRPPADEALPSPSLDDETGVEGVGGAKEPAASVVTRTELLEADPLPLLKDPMERLIKGIAIIVVFAVIGIVGGRTTWWLVAAGVIVWAVFALTVWWDARAHMQAKGRVLALRNHLRLAEVDAADVVAVKYQFNGRRPDFTLETRDGKSHWVPASRLERGHSTLFAWVGWFAPNAKLDAKSQRYHDHLVAEKLI